MAMASYEEKIRILTKMRQDGGKYAKPFDKGQLAMTNFLGGDWNEYAAVVFDMMIADTLLDVVVQLAQMNKQLEGMRLSAIPAQAQHLNSPPPPPPSMARQGG